MKALEIYNTFQKYFLWEKEGFDSAGYRAHDFSIIGILPVIERSWA